MVLEWVVHSVYTPWYPKQDGYVKRYPDGGSLYHEGGETKCPTTMFQMPLHYPRYKKVDYEKMEKWKVDMLLKEYGISFQGTLDEKRKFAMGAFLWPDQTHSYCRGV